MVALTTTPSRGELQTSTTLVVSRVTTRTNTTELDVRLLFPNGTAPNFGDLYAGSFEGNRVDGRYVFDNMTPGLYELNFTGVTGIYFPSASVKVTTGLNTLNVTVYQLEVFNIVVTPGPELNSSTPAPTISVFNNTVVRFEIYNNTTLIQNLAVTSTLNNTNYSSILFDSLSNNVGAGGSANDTFIVSKVGKFYYECLIGNDAKDGEYGEFLVV